jgi:hypothetical protein
MEGGMYCRGSTEMLQAMRMLVCASTHLTGDRSPSTDAGTLVARVRAILACLNALDPRAARCELVALRDRVHTLARSGALGPESAQDLMHAARWLIAAL